MSIAKIWVVAEVVDGAPTTTSLELVSHARTLADTVEAVVWGDGASAAGALGEYGATTVHDVGDLGGALPGAPVAAAIAAAVGPDPARTPSCCPPPTTAATSPAACRSSSTVRS